MDWLKLSRLNCNFFFYENKYYEAEMKGCVLRTQGTPSDSLFKTEYLVIDSLNENALTTMNSFYSKFYTRIYQRLQSYLHFFS